MRDDPPLAGDSESVPVRHFEGRALVGSGDARRRVIGAVPRDVTRSPPLRAPSGRSHGVGTAEGLEGQGLDNCLFDRVPMNRARVQVKRAHLVYRHVRDDPRDAWAGRVDRMGQEGMTEEEITG